MWTGYFLRNAFEMRDNLAGVLTENRPWNPTRMRDLQK